MYSEVCTNFCSMKNVNFSQSFGYADVTKLTKAVKKFALNYEACNSRFLEDDFIEMLVINMCEEQKLPKVVSH